jgi:transcriptional regulator with XRE-family HTH domain
MKEPPKKRQQDVSLEERFGSVLQQLRKERGVSQEELGSKSGYHRTYISLLERGKKSPSLKTIFQLAKAIDMTPSDIIGLVEKSRTTISGKKRTQGRTEK